MAGVNTGSGVGGDKRGGRGEKKKLEGEDLQSDTFTFMSLAIRSVPARVVGLGGLTKVTFLTLFF